MNPLLAAIDLHEALPRVIHDPDKKIHCRIQTERTFLFYIGYDQRPGRKSVIFYDGISDVIERFCSTRFGGMKKHQMSSQCSYGMFSITFDQDWLLNGVTKIIHMICQRIILTKTLLHRCDKFIHAETCCTNTVGNKYRWFFSSKNIGISGLG